jgi:hypothetical protein
MGDEFEFDGGDEYMYEQPPEFLMEINAFERVGGPIMSFLQTHGENIAKHIRKLSKEDRFKTLVIIEWLRFKEALGYGENISDTFIDAFDAIPHIGYKNPKLFVVSFYCLENNKINKTRLNRLFEMLETESIFKRIQKEDVVKYARLWEMILSS